MRRTGVFGGDAEPTCFQMNVEPNHAAEMVDLYRPRRILFFAPERIVLAKGSTSSPARRRLADAICARYPEAHVVECPDVPHNRVPMEAKDILLLHRQGKRTLVFGEHQSAVRFSEEDGNCCPNYWHFSPYGFCPYGCDYCYLAGTPGVRFSPTVKIFLNLPQILGEVGRIASQLKKPTAFYLGKLQDGLALDPLTGYSREMIPFFASHPLARLTILTKSADVENLLPLEHRGHTTLSWTVNPPEVAEAFEKNAPGVPDRIEAMRRCSEAGYPVRAVVMPMVPIADWECVYRRFVEELLSRVRLNRITLGSICSYPHALRLTELKLGRSNPISRNLDPSGLKCGDGRLRFSRSLREGMYREVIHSIRRIQPDLEIGLCLENEATFGALDLRSSVGRCNCVL